MKNIIKIVMVSTALFFPLCSSASGDPCENIAGKYIGTWAEPGSFWTCRYKVNATISKNDKAILISLNLYDSNHPHLCDARPIYMDGYCNKGVIDLISGEGSIIGNQVIWRDSMPSGAYPGTVSFALEKSS